jgi:hypothetical protein
MGQPNIYGTDPSRDTDGDGVSDGEELFGIYTDPSSPEARGQQLIRLTDARSI